MSKGNTKGDAKYPYSECTTLLPLALHSVVIYTLMTGKAHLILSFAQFLSVTANICNINHCEEMHSLPTVLTHCPPNDNLSHGISQSTQLSLYPRHFLHTSSSPRTPFQCMQGRGKFREEIYNETNEGDNAAIGHPPRLHARRRRLRQRHPHHSARGASPFQHSSTSPIRPELLQLLQLV